MIRLLALLIVLNVQAFGQCPGPVIGTAVSIPNGSFNCTQQSFPTAIGINSEGSSETMCYSYYNVGPINLSYLLVNGLCGPFPLYNTLSFTIYDSSCNTVMTSGTVVPTSTNATVTVLNPNTWYTICYTWNPNCPQFSACPLIYTTALPVELIDFSVKKMDGFNKITWTTASQTDVDSFIVHRSFDLNNWQQVESVYGNGSTITQHRYDIEDLDIYNTTVYYKLSEKLYSGQRNDLSIISVNRNDIPRVEKSYDMSGREVSSGSTIRIDGTRIKVVIE